MLERTDIYRAPRTLPISWLERKDWRQLKLNRVRARTFYYFSKVGSGHVLCVAPSTQYCSELHVSIGPFLFPLVKSTGRSFLCNDGSDFSGYSCSNY